jgi:hypothetical protein
MMQLTQYLCKNSANSPVSKILAQNSDSPKNTKPSNWSLPLTFILASCVSSSLINCAPKPSNNSQIAPGALSGAQVNSNSAASPEAKTQGISTLKVAAFGSGAAVPDAKILIGQRIDQPFAGNLVLTDAKGEASVTSAWSTPESITIEAKGFVRTTYTGIIPNSNRTFLIKPVASKKKLELSGETQGFGTLVNDGIVDVGIVFPTIDRSSLTSLQASSILSSEIDTISILGKKIDLPSNMTLPTQSETYIFPITLDKPKYRSYFNETKNWNIAAVHGSFNLDDMVNATQAKKSIYEIINLLTFKSVGLKDVKISSAKQSTNLDVDDIEFQKTIPFTAPQFNASNFKMLAIAVLEKGLALVPSDIKSVSSRQSITLTGTRDLSTSLVISILRAASNDATTGAATEELSALVQKANQTSSLAPLDLVLAPTISAKSISFQPPKTVSTAVPRMTYLALNRVQQVGAGKYKFDSKELDWEVYASGWTSKFELPEMPTLTLDINSSSVDNKAIGARRWEVMFGAQAAGVVTGTNAGPEVVGELTLATRAATDF